MFWHILLAHFMADYPLQSTWMVRNKIHFWVLVEHVSIHFVVMLVVLLPAAGVWWPYLLAIAAIHFMIDAGKNWLYIHRPQWVRGPYLIDQALHILTIALVSQWAASRVEPQQPYLPTQAAVIAIGFLLVSSVYMISERILLRGIPAARARNASGVWGRMFFRAGLLAALLLGWNSHTAAMAGLTSLLPYPATRSGLRALLVDLLVTVLTAILVIAVSTVMNGRNL
jgi:hypothetical protein